MEASIALLATIAAVRWLLLDFHSCKSKQATKLLALLIKAAARLCYCITERRGLDCSTIEWVESLANGCERQLVGGKLSG